ncbi:hypothetical protein NP603_04615 [Methylomonas sp. SURF-1]|uniref:Uncharacterized protein n=1 Tax=Methylomonas aurea TaxID=2952224 RepID=A0ABT1UG47_9GAMM|nr:hypothetical protein [Methylomonas sp. SURF-1]MCQ8180381.1 hypothetical protein [Methylomonas sp. SURF-1]
MFVMRRWLAEVLTFWRRSADENLHWRLSRQDDLEQLRREQALAEQELVAELKKRSQQLAHELALNKARNQNELAMLKTRCRQDLQDYQQYLQSLDRLKDSLRRSYSHLPEAVAFTIHHHAKQLLNRMWEADEPQQKLKIEMQLLQLMTAVHEDSRARLQSDVAEGLPQRALACIDADLDNQIG